MWHEIGRIRVAQRLAALVPVQRSSSLFPNTYYFFDPHLVPVSDSLSRIVAAGQLITGLPGDAWSVNADLF